MGAFEGHEVFFITYEGTRTRELNKKYTMKNLGKNPLKYIISIPLIVKTLIYEKPDIIISTGSEIAIPVFFTARLLGIRTMFIESLCRVKEPSMTGKIIYPISSVFLVQWKQLLKKYGKKAQYWGRVF
jgi:UDP-N-acetylglucosamine:LPS N-acetylglucosamine transferase